MQRARYGRCRHSKAIDIFLYVLDFFFMLNPETLFFVQHQKPQVVKFHVLRQQAVSAYYKVDIPLFKRG